MAKHLSVSAPEFEQGIEKHKTIEEIVVPKPVQTGHLEDIQSTGDINLKTLAVSTLTESVKGSEKFGPLYDNVRDHVLTCLQTEKSLVGQVNKKRAKVMHTKHHIAVIQEYKVCPRQNENCNGSCNLPHNPDLDIETPQMAGNEYARSSVMNVELFGLLIAHHDHDSTKERANTAVRTLKAGGPCASRASLEEFNRSVISICAMVNAKINTIAECMTFTKSVGVKILKLTEELKKLDDEIADGSKTRAQLQNELRSASASASASAVQSL
jgi:hypothetical protein